MRTAGTLLCSLLLATTLHAADNPKNAPSADPDRDYRRLKIDPQGQPLPADTAASDAAKADLDTAKTDLTKAIGTVNLTTPYQVDNALLKTTDYRDAAITLRRAQADYDNARAPIFAALRDDDLYKELERRDAENQKIIQALIIMGRGNFDWLFPPAIEALEIRKSITREQIIAMAQAPEVEDARQRMLIAAARLRGLRGDYVNQNNAGPAARAAATEVDDARKKVRTAQGAYNTALAREAQYERIRQNYLAEQRLTGKAPVIAG